MSKYYLKIILQIKKEFSNSEKEYVSVIYNKNDHHSQAIKTLTISTKNCKKLIHCSNQYINTDTSVDHRCEFSEYSAHWEIFMEHFQSHHDWFSEYFTIMYNVMCPMYQSVTDHIWCTRTRSANYFFCGHFVPKWSITQLHKMHFCRECYFKLFEYGKNIFCIIELFRNTGSLYVHPTRATTATCDVKLKWVFLLTFSSKVSTCMFNKFWMLSFFWKWDVQRFVF